MTRTDSGRSEAVHFEKERGVTAVQVTKGIAHATVELIRDSPEALAEVQLGLLQALAAASIPVFFIKLHPTGISFALLKAQQEKTVRILRDCEAKFEITEDLALLALIAGAMRDLSGVMANLYECFVSNGTTVIQTSDAYNAVLCLISADHADSAAEDLNERFGLNAIAADTGAGERRAL